MVIAATFPASGGDAVMAAPTHEQPNAPTLLDVVRVLQITYTDAGVLEWLASRNFDLDGYPPEYLIGQGRTSEVLAAAQRIEGGS